MATRSGLVNARVLDPARQDVEACAHSFSAAASLELGQWGFDAQRCESCGAVLLAHDEQPLATEDALRNAGVELEEFAGLLDGVGEELAAFRARETGVVGDRAGSVMAGDGIGGSTGGTPAASDDCSE
jgi:hypothetical protein